MESPSGSVYPIVDRDGNKWTIVAGSAAMNGVRDARTHNVVGLLYWGQSIYEINNFGYWKLTGSGWIAATDPRSDDPFSPPFTPPFGSGR